MPGTALSERMHEADLERQDIKNNLKNHEEICAERYTTIQLTLSALKTSIDKLDGKFEVISIAQVKETARAEKPKWWLPIVIALAVTTMTCIFGLIGWLGAQVYADQNARIETLKRQSPTQTVTVQSQP